MKVKLAYGKSGLDITVPDRTTVIQQRHLPGLDNEKEHALAAMRNPIGSAPLCDLVKHSDTVSIVISDMTRPTPNHKLIPWILEEISHVPRSQITIINGTGSHRDNTRDELIQMLGEEVINTVNVINNNAFDESTLTYLGKSPLGAPIYLNRTYCESDFRIVTGFIEPHFFAGFSGGPKGIMPGIAGIDTILYFHNAMMIGNPLSDWGVLDGNPVQSEATAIGTICRPEFMLNVTLNRDKEITAFFAGDVIQAHRVGCEFVRDTSMVACDSRFDIVITTNSGYPLDQNMYQASKGLSAAHRIVKQGGAIIGAMECSDGLPEHGNYSKILQMGKSPREVLDIIENRSFSMFDQWAAQKQCLVQLWADVYIYSLLPPDEVRKVLLTPIASIENKLKELLNEYGEAARIAVLPLGPLTIPYIAGK